MSERKNLSPPSHPPEPGIPPTRRAGGARHEVSERVHFYKGAKEISGWALNVSRGGVRAIIEDPVELGDEFQVVVGDSNARPGRIVWMQEEPDGAIVGVSYLDHITKAPLSHPPPSSSALGSAPPPSDAGKAPA